MDERRLCYRCRKAKVTCYCADLRPFASEPEFVILIHPKETRKAINTGRMAFLSLTNAHLRVGVDFTDDPVLEGLIADPGRNVYLLFPGPLARDLKDLPRAEPGRDVFVILDATWSMAKSMLKASPNLQALPRVMFEPPRASEFSIRQQPGLICYSTIETIHHVIESGGGMKGGEHHHLLTLFRAMVRTQIACESIHRAEV